MWTLLDLHKHSLRGRRIPLHSQSLLLKLCKWRRKLLLVKPFFLVSVFYFFTSFCRTLSFFMYFLPLCSYLCMIGVKIFNSSCISFAFFFFFNCVSLAYFRCVSVLFFACFVSLCSVCFDFKLIPEMIFRKSGCLVVTSNLVKLKSISSWPKNIAKTTENYLCFHFHFKWLPALENRRERERESKKIADVGARRLHRSDHSNPPSSNPVTDHWDRLAISGPHTKKETERVERSSHREPTRTNSFSISFEIFVIKFVCDFIFYFLSLISDFVVVVVAWVVVFWWFSCCVVVGFVGVVVENSIFRMLPNTWNYFLEKFS